MGGVISSIASGIAFGVTWCFCTASMSLCNACCGNDKPSTSAPTLSSGRKRSALLLLLSIALALVFQYALAPALDEYGDNIEIVPKVGPYLITSWTDGCQMGQNSGGGMTTEDVQHLERVCRGNAGVYRVSSASTLLFLLLAIAAKCKPTFNREVWPAKYILFLFLVAGTIFIPNAPLFVPVYMNIARVGGAMFIVMQLLIVIDLAYNWNESWVAKSDEAESNEMGSGKKWLGAILFSAIFLFAGSITVIGLLYHYFQGCSTNTAFITVTLLLIIVATAVQLSGEDASLLTSATIAAYASYLCYESVSRNPNGECNPRLGNSDVLGIVVGIGLTLVSLAWTGFSVTAEERLSSSDDDDEDGGISSNLVMGGGSNGETEVKGVIIGSGNSNYGTTTGDAESGIPVASSSGDDGAGSGGAVASWKINIVLAMVSCWFAMVLTGWGSVEGKMGGGGSDDVGGDAANPQVSRVSMWMIIAAQWTCFALYLWTMVAPRLFPDREFS